MPGLALFVAPILEEATWSVTRRGTNYELKNSFALDANDPILRSRTRRDRVFLFLRSSQLADKTWPQCTQFTTRHRRHCAHCRHNMRSSLWSNRQTSDMIHFMGACNIAFYCTRRWKRRFTMFWCLHDDEVYDAVVDHLETHHLSMLY